MIREMSAPSGYSGDPLMSAGSSANVPIVAQSGGGFFSATTKLKMYREGDKTRIFSIRPPGKRGHTFSFSEKDAIMVIKAL